jgi:hypothetical protein
MPRDIRITSVSFQVAGELLQREGVLGWVRLVVDGWLRLDSLTVRRTASGEIKVFFPERIDNQQRRHAVVWPISAEDRAQIEGVVMKQITGSGALS